MSDSLCSLEFFFSLTGSYPYAHKEQKYYVSPAFQNLNCSAKHSCYHFNSTAMLACLIFRMKKLLLSAFRVLKYILPVAIIFCFILQFFWLLVFLVLLFVSTFCLLEGGEICLKRKKCIPGSFFTLLALERRNLKSDLNNKNEGLMFQFMHLTSLHRILRCYVQSFS